MSRHFLPTGIVLSLLALFLASHALADGTQQTRLVGTLTAIAGNTLTIAGQNNSGNVTVTCNDSTKYRRDASPNTATAFSDLQVNQTLRVYYGSDNIATLVNITK